ncbi:Alpha/Beta hydrolase protein [Paraphysoderma sedebokerense]|nr:Alpha/Beta hydrolase protein [Paraphysoderma sedebokerense]
MSSQQSHLPRSNTLPHPRLSRDWFVGFYRFIRTLSLRLYLLLPPIKPIIYRKFPLLSNVVNFVSELYFVFAEPILISSFQHKPSDLTYGRSSLPPHPSESFLRKPPYFTTEHWIQLRGRSIYYQTWYDGELDRELKGDVLVLHGLNDYGGRFARFATKFIQQGYRVHAPDMFGFGRTDGLHAYFDSVDEQVELVGAVIANIQKINSLSQLNHDIPAFSTKIFLMGASFGGLGNSNFDSCKSWENVFSSLSTIIIVAMQYARKYPSTIHGLISLCPAITLAPSSNPPLIAHLVAPIIRYFLPRLPLVEAHRGQGCTELRYTIEFFEDPLTYHGRIRVGTGLAIKDAMLDLSQNLSEITVPLFFGHGDEDPVCCIKSSKLVFERIGSRDKIFQVYKNCQHDLYVEPKAQAMFKDIMDWMRKRSV